MNDNYLLSENKKLKPQTNNVVMITSFLQALTHSLTHKTH